MADSNKWYVRRSGELKGPFTFSVLEKLARLGRLQPSDELSEDTENWKPAAGYPGLFPKEGITLPLKEDERTGIERRDQKGYQTSSENKRQGKDRRKPESEEEVFRRRGRTQLLQAIRESRKEDHFPATAVIVSLLVIVIIGYLLTPSKNIPEPDCEAPPGPGVFWDNCRFGKLTLKNKDLSEASITNAVLSGANLQGANLSHANLAYTDLRKANLSDAILDRANLKGASLKFADLRSASLKQADLSYVDFRWAKLEGASLDQAILDKAIWVDGTICKPGSIGSCID